MVSRTKSEIQPPSADQIEDLTSTVLTLTEQVRCLRHAIDEVEQELGWAIRTRVIDRLPPPRSPSEEPLGRLQRRARLGTYRAAVRHRGR